MKIKVLHTDRGGEYVNGILEKFCNEKGIKIELIVPHTPEQDSAADRTNQKILDKGRTLLKDARATDYLQADSCLCHQQDDQQPLTVDPPFELFRSQIFPTCAFALPTMSSSMDQRPGCIAKGF
jgi:hypothetical protein